MQPLRLVVSQEFTLSSPFLYSHHVHMHQSPDLKGTELFGTQSLSFSRTDWGGLKLCSG